jgi:hypothetical protein
LLPAVRAADADALIVTDGFSCREQIARLTDRRALHLAQVLQLALHDGPNVPARLPRDALFRSASCRTIQALGSARRRGFSAGRGSGGLNREETQVERLIAYGKR